MPSNAIGPSPAVRPFSHWIAFVIALGIVAGAAHYFVVSPALGLNEKTRETFNAREEIQNTSERIQDLTAPSKKTVSRSPAGVPIGCANECQRIGQIRGCASATSYKVCGQFDVDPCLEFAGQACASGQQCSNGECKQSDGPSPPQNPLANPPANNGPIPLPTNPAHPAPAQACGNNEREGSETCDGTDLNGQTCARQGYAGGTLSCNPHCNGFDFTACTPDGNVYYLDALNGVDSNPGTSALPWKTLAKAQTTLVEKDRALLRSGDYGAFNETVNANRQQWITYEAETGAEPRFSQISIEGTGYDAYLRFKGIEIRLPAKTDCANYGNATSLLYSTANYIEFHGGKINSERIYDAGNAVYFNALEHLVVDSAEITNTGTGIRYKGKNIFIKNNDIHRIHGTMINALAGPMGENEPNAATDVLIENNRLWDQKDRPNEPCYSEGQWNETHASAIGVRGPRQTIQNNSIHDAGAPIQLYADDAGGTYELADILIAYNTIYDTSPAFTIYNPGPLDGPIVLRNNTIVSGRETNGWTNAQDPATRFRLDQQTQTVFIDLNKNPNYNGQGTIVENNILIQSLATMTRNYEKYTDPTAHWIVRNNIIYEPAWNQGELDPSNVLISPQIIGGTLPAGFIDESLFKKPLYTPNHGQTCDGIACDFTPQQNSIACTMSTTGQFVGSAPCTN